MKLGSRVAYRPDKEQTMGTILYILHSCNAAIVAWDDGLVADDDGNIYPYEDLEEYDG